MRPVYGDDFCRWRLSDHLPHISTGNYSVPQSGQIEHGTRTGAQALACVKRENGARPCCEDAARNSIQGFSLVAAKGIGRVASQKQRCPARHSKEVNDRRSSYKLEPRERPKRWAYEGRAKDYALNPCWMSAGDPKCERSRKRPAQNVEFPQVHDCRFHHFQQVRITVGARVRIRNHERFYPVRENSKQRPEEDVRAVKTGQEYQRCWCQRLM